MALAIIAIEIEYNPCNTIECNLIKQYSLPDKGYSDKLYNTNQFSKLEGNRLDMTGVTGPVMSGLSYHQ